MAVIDLEDVKSRLNKSLNVDDYELLSMLDAALAEYAQVVGPIGEQTLSYYGQPLPRNAIDVVVTDADGQVIDITGYGSTYVATPYLRWNEPAGWMGHFGGTTLTATYTGDLPANHREAIIADVAGYFAATQRGGGQSAPRFPGEGYAEAYDAPGSPLTLFPRIRALASASIA